MYKYLCFLAMSIFAMNVIHAADIETLLMPDKVIEGHAEYESECSRCHAHFSKRTQSDLCRDCHEDIDADIRNNRGYHSHVPDIKNKPCKSCHTDHTGRKADIVMLNLATFDHGNTDFLLENGHKGVPCSNCHLQNMKFSEASSSCFDCHEKQDPHKGKLGEKCGNCHTAKSWEEFDFDHDKTEFRLEGKHQDVACNVCHINNNYKETPKDCHSCHYLNDVHEGRHGKKCQDCHSTRKWDESEFDHDRETEFKLTGKHKDISCKTCHTKALANKKPGKECYSCHKHDDNHRGRYGKKCHSCHKQNSWESTQFDHTSSTRFPLKGKHKQLICESCHQGVLSEENLSVDCHSCHRADDVHKSKQGEQCQRCHQDTGWSDGVLFDHDLTHFPLLGMHALANQALWVLMLLSWLFLLIVWLSGGHPPLWLFMVVCLTLFFCIGVLFGNLNSIAMEPLGHVAGTGAGAVGSFSTVLAVVLGFLIGRGYDESLFPMAIGFVCLTMISVLLTKWADLPE